MLKRRRISTHPSTSFALRYASPASHHLSGDPLFVIIRNFDEPAYGYIDGPKVLNEFLRFVELDVMTRKVDGVLLVSTRNDGTIEHCRGRAPGGPMPSYPALYRLELERTLDLSHHPAFQTSAGFTEDEIEDLDRALEAGIGNGSRSKSTRISSPPVMHRVKNGYTWGALFADSNWFTAQKTWTGSWRQGNGDDPSKWLQTLNTDDEDTAVYCARDLMELLREKYGFPLTCERWFES
ncbi:hypothetical protein HMN09_00396700 [Mycena chlorophos]|uniref:Uncharacterized protein n=1 Tax=Mycena chlorophos TaxID=658473 RepID=A0A8H6TFZ3_MYCCL|nr:hypothetical protein HMN09_00396700 [Mycena chlorophos]